VLDFPRYPMDTTMPDGYYKNIGGGFAGGQWLCALAVLIISTGCATAETISYTTTLITPGVPGAAVWQNDYTFSGFNLGLREAIQLQFDVMAFQSLSNGVALPASDWDLLVLQPDPGAPHNGVYDMMALVDAPSFAGPFSIQYTLLPDVAAPPSTQGYQVIQYDSDYMPGPVLSTGTASSTTVPEPASIWLAAAAAAGLIRCAARRRT
jgi:hypothetical protein